MLVAIQIPVADSREFVGSDTEKLAVPGWPVPQVDAEFIRGIGPVRARRRGGLAEWVGEDYYVEADRALRFPPVFGQWKLQDVEKFTGMTCIFRRYFSDGVAVSRVEVGFEPRAHQSRYRRPPLTPLGGGAVLDLVKTCLSVRTSIAQPHGERIKLGLIDGGPALARYWLHATTKRPTSLEPEQWWMKALHPIVVVTYSSRVFSHLPRVARAITLHEDAPEVVHHLSYEVSGQTVPVWLVSEALGDDLVRRTRLHLFRLHAEREVLRWMFNRIARGELTRRATEGEPVSLEKYLDDALTLISGDSEYGIGPTDDLRRALRLRHLVNPGEEQALLFRLRDLREKVLTKVERAADTGIAPMPAAEPLGGATIVSGPTFNYNLHGPNPSVHGVFGSGIAVSDSFNRIDQASMPEEMKETLRHLLRATADLSSRIEDDSMRGELQRSVSGMVDEVAAPTPEPTVIEAFGKRVARIASAFGAVGVPLVELATEVMKVFVK